MTFRDYSIVVILFILAIFIWLRDLAWVSSFDDTIPILVAIPLFFWMGKPWNFKKDSSPLSLIGTIVGTILFLFGIVTNLTFLMALAWTLFLWNWLYTKIPVEKRESTKKLLVLPLLAFPWVAFDITSLGWWFRLSGATVTSNLFELFGFDVAQEGTNILIDQHPISVEAACAGLNTLQSMLIAGTIVDYIFLGSSVLYWWNLPLLVGMAWLANTVRVIGITLAVIYVGRDFAMGAFHTWGGWVILMFMFFLCWAIFALEEKFFLRNKKVGEGDK